jgi:hypothetical protein
MRLVYVFDCTTETDYICRVPEWYARRMLRRSSRPLDYCRSIPADWVRAAN